MFWINNLCHITALFEQLHLVSIRFKILNGKQNPIHFYSIYHFKLTYCFYTIYHYIPVNKYSVIALIIHHINVVTKATGTFTVFYLKNSHDIHLHCFSQYQKYLCKIFSFWIYPLSG